MKSSTPAQVVIHDSPSPPPAPLVSLLPSPEQLTTHVLKMGPYAILQPKDEMPDPPPSEKPKKFKSSKDGKETASRHIFSVPVQLEDEGTSQPSLPSRLSASTSLLDTGASNLASKIIRGLTPATDSLGMYRIPTKSLFREGLTRALSSLVILAEAAAQTSDQSKQIRKLQKKDDAISWNITQALAESERARQLHVAEVTSLQQEMIGVQGRLERAYEDISSLLQRMDSSRKDLVKAREGVSAARMDASAARSEAEIFKEDTTQRKAEVILLTQIVDGLKKEVALLTIEQTRKDEKMELLRTKAINAKTEVEKFKAEAHGERTELEAHKHEEEGRKDDFIKYSEFAELVGAKAFPLLKIGFEGCKDQFKAHDFPPNYQDPDFFRFKSSNSISP